jgi:SNF2 family DNA or RNA helicase
MGLGKTLQSISLILTNPRPSPTSPEYAQRKLPEGLEKMTLVVAPLALIRQWEAELKDKVSSSRGMRVCVHHGAKRTKRYQDLRRYDVVITTYQVLVAEKRASASEDDGIQVGCFGLHWYRVILDEAHQIKNRNAQATQACYALRAQYRWCLTGTPMQNNLDELQSLIRFLRIQPYNNLAVWREMITNPLKNGRGGVAIKRLKVVLKAFMKRRTKDVLKRDGALGRAAGGKSAAAGSKDGGGAGGTGSKQPAFQITERRVEELAAEFSPAERQFYERLEQRTDQRLEQLQEGGGISYANALTLLLRLRQACNHPQLVAGKLGKDPDALAVDVDDGKGNRKAKSGGGSSQEVDDVADLFGGLSVDNRKCEVCLIDLSAESSSSGALRCASCESYIEDMRNTGKDRQKKKKKKEEASSGRAKKNRAIVLDSDDEDGGDHNSAGDEEKEEENGDEADDGGSDEADYETASQPDEEEDAGSLGALIASTKIKRLMKLLHAEADEHKFIVFSQFTSMLDLIEPFLHRDGLVFARYDGKMRNDQREASLNLLRKDDRTRILLCSLKCGSLGLNLTAASRVIIIEPFYNPVRDPTFFSLLPSTFSSRTPIPILWAYTSPTHPPISQHDFTKRRS